MPRFQGPTSHDGLVGLDPGQLEELLHTKPFKFLVGSEGKEFYIHRGLVARLSAPLNALVNGGMRESQEGSVTFDDVDEDVFARFAQFAYTAEYTGFSLGNLDATSPSAEQASEITAAVVEKLRHQLSPRESGATSFTDIDPLTNEPFDYNSFSLPVDTPSPPGPMPNDKKDSFKLPYSLETFNLAATNWINGQCHSSNCRHNPKSALPPPIQRYRGGPGSSKRRFEAITCDCDTGNEGTPSPKKRDFISAFMVKQGSLALQPAACTNASSAEKTAEPVFVGHARVWVFADRYAVVSLMDLACAHLVRELACWTMRAERFVVEFGGLVRYVYDEHTVAGCQLRLLVAQFAACVVEDVTVLEEWPGLLNEVPDFAVDLVSQMTNRFA